MNARRGELVDKVWYRSERFFCVDGKWYFSTREGTDVGPYANRSAAASGLILYIQYMQTNPEQGQLYASKIARRGLWETTLYH